MLRRIVALLALAAVGIAIVGVASSAHAASCGQLTLSVDGVPQPMVCDARPADAFGVQRVRSYLYSGLTVTGQLLTAAGNPSAGAPITVVSSVSGVVASGKTNSEGWYGLRVPRGPSRLLTIEALGDALMIRELVAPNVSLRVHAHRRAVLILWGDVLCDFASPAPTVVLQDLAPNGWQTFGVAAVRAGRYRYIYHSDASTVGDRFALRATTMPTAAWQPGVSGVRYATVRP